MKKNSLSLQYYAYETLLKFFEDYTKYKQLPVFEDDILAIAYPGI